MLKLFYNMRIGLFATFLLATITFSMAAESEHDAEILYNEEVRIFNFKKESTYYRYTQVYRVKRKIQVNTAYGLKQFNTLYIPTHEDLNYEMTLSYVTARTIKKSGEVIEISDKHIRETSLPANVPLLYGYNGKVKQMVFSHVLPGDVIEYEYEVIYNGTSSYPYLNLQNTILVAQEVPIKKAHFRFALGRGLDGLFYISNGTQPFTREKKNHYITLENIPAVTLEDYTSHSAESPYILYDVMNDDSGVYDSWEKYIKRKIDGARNNELFMGGKSIADFNRLVRQKRLTSTEDKIRAVMNDINEFYSHTDSKYLWSIYKSSMSMEDAKQVLKMIDIMDLNASVLFLRNRKKGPIIKDYISVSQFEYVVVEFAGNDGKKHIWEPINPYGTIDQYPYFYSGNEALRIGFNEEKISFDWYDVPRIEADENRRSTEIEIQLIGESRPIRANARLSRNETGQYAYFSKPELKLEKNHKEVNNYSTNIKNEINNWFFNTKVQDPEFDLNEKDEIEYSIDYSYTIFNGLYNDKLEFNIRDFIPSLTFTNLNKERNSTAYLNFSREVNYSLTILLPESYFTFVQNDFLDRDIDNEVASFKVNTTYSDDHFNIDISYKLKQDVLSPEQWKQYVEVMNDIQSFYFQKILLEM